jgi:hypothetical protein
MDSLFTIFNISQTSFLMYLLSSATLILALAVNFYFWRHTPAGIPRRLVSSLALMLFVELAALIATIVLNADSSSGMAWLPPIDRFQMAFILIWLLWLWAFPEGVLWTDILVVILSLGALAGLIVSLMIWPASAETGNFNRHWLDTAWQVFCLVYAIILVIALAVRRKRLWLAGILTGVFFMFGHALQLILPDLAENYAIPVRLATLVSLPLLLILPLGIPAPASEAHNAGLRRGRDKRDRRRFSTELPTALGFLSLVWEDNPQTAIQLLVKSIGRALLADICLFTTPPNQNSQVTVLAGHDFYNHVDVKEFKLDRQRIPRVIDALMKNHTLRLSEEYSDTPDAAYLCRVVHFNGTAPLLFHPVSKSNAWQIGGILLLTPYTRRAWTENDSRYIAGLTEALLRIIVHKQANLDAASETQRLIEEQRDSGRTILNLQNELQELSTELDKFQSRISVLEIGERQKQNTSLPLTPARADEPEQPRKGPSRDATVRLNPLVVEKYESTSVVAKLKEENDALRQLIAHISAGPEEVDGRPMNQTERELRSSLEEVARLKNMLANADMKLRQFERRLQDNA